MQLGHFRGQVHRGQDLLGDVLVLDERDEAQRRLALLSSAKDVLALYDRRMTVEICQSRCCPPDVQIYVAPRLRGFLFASGTRDRQGRLSAPAQLRCVP
jgi:hypothetical protein